MLKLGTKPHHDAMLAGIDRLDPTGCFALTELGFGDLPYYGCALHEYMTVVRHAL